MGINQHSIFPVAEMFYSVQGEGERTGQHMLFLRLAGCNVGRYEDPADTFSICTTFDGRTFQCDTDYHARLRLSAQSIAEQLKEMAPDSAVLSITGGEPFLHKGLLQLLKTLLAEPFIEGIHIETSGTYPISPVIGALRADSEWQGEGKRVWVACSPKKGFLLSNLEYINELKFLVDEHFNEDAVAVIVGERHEIPVWLQPVNTTDNVDDANLQRCREICSRHPNWRLSIQLHKILGVA